MGTYSERDRRRKIIDRCLRSERGYSVKEIMEKCNESLRATNSTTISATNTIRQDIEDIEKEFPVEVIMVKKGREKKYRYKDTDFSIYNQPLTAKELNIIQETVDRLKMYEGRPNFEWVKNLDAYVKQVVDCNQPDKLPIVGFDENPLLTGREFFDPLFNAISNQQTLEFTYKPFQSGEVTNLIYPYYLHEYNKRWFLLAATEGYNELSIYALDRIVSFKDSDKPYKAADNPDFKKYFSDRIGVSRIKGKKEVETIQLWVRKSLLSYIKTKPIHHSQEIISEDEKGAVVQLKVIHNIELEHQILAYAGDLFVLSPQSLVERMKEKIKKNADFYNRCSAVEPIDDSFAANYEVKN